MSNQTAVREKEEARAITDEVLERRLRISAGLLTFGLVVEGVSLAWQHPTAFLLFGGIGGLLMAAGMGLYLITIATRGG